ncbi:hypothetical protein V6N13_033967 [Hibiscus sabdariffa]
MGSIDDTKAEILQNWAIGWCHLTRKIPDIVKELKESRIQGFSIRQLSSSMVLLMFSNDEVRTKMLHDSYLSQCFSHVEIWAPEYACDNGDEHLDNNSTEGDSFSSKDDSVKEFEQRENNGDMHKQYSMYTVMLDSTADRSQDIGLQKFMGVDGVEGDVDGVSDTRDVGWMRVRVFQLV